MSLSAASDAPFWMAADRQGSACGFWTDPTIRTPASARDESHDCRASGKRQSSLNAQYHAMYLLDSSGSDTDVISHRRPRIVEVEAATARSVGTYVIIRVVPDWIRQCLLPCNPSRLWPLVISFTASVKYADGDSDPPRPWVAELTRTVQVPVPEHPPFDHPANPEPVAVVALSVTRSLSAHVLEQVVLVPPQSMPVVAFVLVMIPTPLPGADRQDERSDRRERRDHDSRGGHRGGADACS